MVSMMKKNISSCYGLVLGSEICCGQKTSDMAKETSDLCPGV